MYRSMIFLLSLIFFPSLLMASGGDVLMLMWLEIGLFIAMMLFLAFVERSVKGKLTIILFYIISVGLTLWITSNLPYIKNMLMINTICIGVPMIFLIFGMILTRKP